MLQNTVKASAAYLIGLLTLCASCSPGETAKTGTAANVEAPATTAAPQPSAGDKAEMMRQMAIISETTKQLSAYYIGNLITVLQKLPEGSYRIGPQVAYITAEGRFRPPTVMGITRLDTATQGATPIDNKLRREIEERLAALTPNCPQFQVMGVNGQPTFYDVDGPTFTIRQRRFIVPAEL